MTRSVSANRRKTTLAAVWILCLAILAAPATASAAAIAATLSPTSGTVGATIHASSTGWRASSAKICLYWQVLNPSPLACAAANSAGALSTSFIVPNVAPGQYQILIEDFVFSEDNVALPFNVAEAAAPACGTVLVSGGSWLSGRGVAVHSNGTSQTTGNSCAGFSTSSPSTQDGYGWQCIELATRLYAVRGWGSVYADSKVPGDPYRYGARYIPEGSTSLTFHANGSGYVPVPGDLIIEGGDTWGHVAIVDSVSGSTINAVEQNASTTGRHAYTLSGSTIAGGYNVVRGIEHSPSNGRVGVLTTSWEALVKEGGLSAQWVDEYGGVKQIVVSPNRVGILSTSGEAFVKEGGLSTSWTDEFRGVQQLAVTDNRIGVLTTSGEAFVKEGGLSAQWVDEYGGVKQMALA
jgi:hypothetical protein